jgi:hypothetical protein
MARLLFWVVLALLPFAVIETLTRTKPLITFFGMFFPTVDGGWMPPRMGLQRVTGPFEHSILFGVFCGSTVALTYLVVGRSKTALARLTMTGAVIAASFLSLSSGAIAGVVAHVLLLIWNWLLRGIQIRWKILWGLVAAMYLSLAALSNQSVPEFYISRFAFDQNSAYARILIWRYGSATALNNPFFGVGLGDWERPDWLFNPSIDMFWLIHAVRHGIPAGILALLFLFSAFVAVGLRKGLSGQLLEYRTAYLITMFGFFIVGWTVHFWNATYALFMFLVGSGIWLLDAKVDQRIFPATEDPSSRQPRPNRLQNRVGPPPAPSKPAGV